MSSKGTKCTWESIRVWTGVRTRTKKLHYGAREIKNPVTEKKFDYQFYPKIFQSRDLNFSYPGSFLMTTLMLKSKFQNSSFLKSKGIKFESNHC